MTPLILITALPHFVSLEQHRELVASTPASFSDIPPVLRHKEENVSVSIEPALEGFTQEDAANGTLYVIESALVFLSSTGRGFQIEYPAIILHAISRPIIYCQLDESVGEPESTSNDPDADTPMRELIITPKDTAALDPIFEGLSFCAALHPDPASLSDDMDDAFIDADENGFETFTGNEEQELSEVGKAALAYMESIIYNPFDKEQQESTTDDKKADDEQPSEKRKRTSNPE